MSAVLLVGKGEGRKVSVSKAKSEIDLGQTTNNLLRTVRKWHSQTLNPDLTDLLYHTVYYMWHKHLEFNHQILCLFLFVYISFSIILGMTNVCQMDD